MLDRIVRALRLTNKPGPSSQTRAPVKRRPWLRAILRGVCPRCHQGRLLTGATTVNDQCPVCGLKLVREQGWFLTAMYFNYILGIPLLLILTVLLWVFVLPYWSVEWVVFVAILPFLFFVPLIVRYSRILAIHLDYLLEPHDDAPRQQKRAE